MPIRSAVPEDSSSIWSIIEPVIREGSTYALPVELTEDEALLYWFSPGHHVFVFEENGEILGTYYLRPNQRGGGAHVANCGYMTSASARGRGIASQMCEDSLDRARALGFRAMQFNFVVSTNTQAIRLWLKHGFRSLGRVPAGFRHPTLGFVDAEILFREL